MLQPASAAQIKDGLKQLSSKELLELTLKLARFKKENKELISYRLFHGDDPQSYLTEINDTVSDLFQQMNHQSLFIMKKQVRRIVTLINRHLKYVADAEIEVGARMYFLEELQRLKSYWRRSNQITRVHDTQLKKIDQAIAKLHPDLQSDYDRKFVALSDSA